MPIALKKYSDERLFLLLKGGDRAAYEELYNRYKRSLTAYALKKMTSDEAEDLIHDLWVRIWERRENAELKGSVVSYLFKATRNRIIDYMACSDHAQRYLDSIISFTTSDEINDTDYLIREKVFLETIEKTLNKYSPKAESIIRMRMQGYNNHEIAEMLNLSEKTIRNEHSSIVKYLRSKFSYVLIFLFF